MESTAANNFNKHSDQLRPYDPTLRTYTRTPPPDEPDYGLCTRCHSIDFRAICSIDPRLADTSFNDAQQVFWPEGTKAQDRVVELDTHKEIYLASAAPVFDLGPTLASTNPCCSLCRLFISIATTWGNHNVAGPWYLGIKTNSYPGLYLIGRSASWIEEATERGELLVSPSCSSKIWSNSSRNAGRTFHSSEINYNFLVSAVEHCRILSDEQWRNESVATDSLLTSGFRLIDCRDCRVVSVVRRTEYIALSYLWGPGRRADDLFIDGQGHIINERLVQTIRDAMQVTLLFGQRYLWVDRYCIDQQDKGIFRRQIDSMDKVFQQSWATIVALGPDDQTGLPGVSIQRLEKPHVLTAQCDLTTYGPGLVSYYRNSHWRLRAWTFQELLLSSRLLTFTPTQVFLTCKHGTVCEAFPDAPHAWDTIEDIFRDTTTARVNSEKLLGSDYQDKIRREEAQRIYCNRELTHEDDSLTAFKGFMSASEFDFIFGIPIFPAAATRVIVGGLAGERETSDPIGMCIGLGWHCSGEAMPVKPLFTVPQKDGSICRAFPSWSWASCRPGDKTFPPSGRAYRTDRATIHAARVLSESSDGKLIEWEQQMKHPEEVLSMFLHMKTRLVPFTVKSQEVYFDRYGRFGGLELAWSVIGMTGLGTSNVKLSPDVRAPCHCHSHLNILWEPDKIKADITGQAALLYVELTEFSKLYAVAHWLALRYDEASGAMRRLGIIYVSFDARRGDTLWRKKPKGTDSAVELRKSWDAFRTAFETDLRGEGNVGIVKVR